ncbi:hypothetical protein [Cellulophaga baltica]|uniref:DUF4328 domain-containing protein n=1 Tax=Cellulophaga baltica TaxID=76594 RepID=A0A1G7M929_9FLAO|nr:hypothetical protein [Cellulophaga baltica]SDF58237.1 hypothetical protein SAMN04487992_1366 [Cellulophaga baltica]
MNVIIKIVITALLLLIAIKPYFEKGQIPGGLSEFENLGLIPSIILIITFFTAIAFYCKSFQTTLNLIKIENRTRKPKSVWYMYLIPFNFIEDFFIIIDISNSLKSEMKSNENLKKFGDFGLTLGIGWSVAQIFSLIPNMAGQISGFVGLILWIIHWSLIGKINKVLKNSN